MGFYSSLRNVLLGTGMALLLVIVPRIVSAIPEGQEEEGMDLASSKR
jgi:hypothetical protein